MLGLLLALLLLASPAEAQQPVGASGAISAPWQTVPLCLAGNRSVSVYVSGTFVGWYQASITNDPAGIARWNSAHLFSMWGYGLTSASNQPGLWEIVPLGGMACVRIEVYQPGNPHFGFTSGQMDITMYATSAESAVGDGGGHVAGRQASVQGNVSLNSRPGCAAPNSGCVPPTRCGYGASCAHTIPSALAQNVCLRWISVLVQGLRTAANVRLIDGSDGVARDLGKIWLDPDQEAWAKDFPQPYCAATGNDLTVYVDLPAASGGSAVTIYAGADR